MSSDGFGTENDDDGENGDGENDDGENGAGSRADQVACTERVVETTPDAAIVSNLGVSSYVLAGVADRARNFYCWGSMGLTTSIGLGLSLATDEGVTVLEGDGSLLMSLGVLGTVAACDPSNLVLVVWENGTYETTGGQRISGIEFAAAARACGVRASRAETTDEFETEYERAVSHDGAALVVCAVERVNPEARPPLEYPFVAQRFRDALS